MRAGEKQFIENGPACHLESLCLLDLWAKRTFVHFSGERAQSYHQILKSALCPQMLQNLGVLANPLGESRGPRLYPEAPVKLWTRPRECSSPPGPPK